MVVNGIDGTSVFQEPHHFEPPKANFLSEGASTSFLESDSSANGRKPKYLGVVLLRHSICVIADNLALLPFLLFNLRPLVFNF